ncbi:hypothetical protein BKA69DRAFT_764083 [Paraphysoderma sedebokerense]|nr:hypothetical protein BKA69DRAFT_764083 [Paraphysoderma sedebokerense]
MGKGGFNIWANYQGLGAGMALVCGGGLAFFYPLWYMGIYGVAIGLIVLAIEYTTPIPVPTFLKNYLFRGLLYLLLTPACFVQAPLFNGGMFLGCCGATYVFAHTQGETGIKKAGGGRGGGGK